MIFTILLFAVYAGLIFYYRQSWQQIPVITVNGQQTTFNSKRTTHNGHSTLISVIIPARNEEENIQNCLQSVVNQTYPKHLFEVIVVDDFSTDGTAEIVRSFSDKKVSLLSLKDFTLNGEINSYKKKAIEIAVSQAYGDLIITTDADCLVPNTWLKTIAAFYETYNPVFIAAPVAFYGENNFLKIFQSLDFMTLQGITGAAVYKKFHCMCNGANLAYRKDVFFIVGGFKGIDAIASGDDMLLMHKIYKQYPDRVLFLKSPDAIVQTKPMDTLRDFCNQRIRWASKADKYTDKKITAVLIMVYFLNVWLLVLGLACFFYRFIFLWFAGLLLAKTIVELFFLYPVARFFHKEKLLWWFPIAQPFHIIYTIVAGWLGMFGTYKWKARRVK